MKYKILNLSNPNNDEFLEDTYIADSFRKDGHTVEMHWVDYDESLDKEFDVVIIRNTWVEDDSLTENYHIKNSILEERLSKKNIKTVNLIGLDGEGKEYLCKFYKYGKKVIPTLNNIEEALNLKNVNEFVLKSKNSFGSGIGQKIVSRNELKNSYTSDYLIQPKINFKSEVQCYFVADKLMYVYEYTPYYPEPHLITLNKEQEELAYEFAKASNLKVGFQRIDFLRLENNDFLLLEIEDNSPHMNLEKLDANSRNKVIEEYKTNIYEYLEKK